jgi:hypothetical protein
VQIVESTVWRVRSARLTLTRRGSPKTVVLFPMLHIGESAFYTTIYGDAFAQEVVLIEGVKSPVSARIGRVYRRIEAAGLGLVMQPRYPAAADCRARIVHADLSAEEFAAVWRTVPLWLRIASYWVSLTISGRPFNSRDKIAKGMSLDDAASVDELINWSPESAFLDRAILEARDRRLLKCLNQELGREPAITETVAVVYGAAHIRAALRELISQGFAVTQADWVTVFDV